MVLNRYFEAQAEKTPDGIAVIGTGGNHLTYRQLNETANRWARLLRAGGVKADSIVPLTVGHSTRCIVGIMAILKAGGAYLPVSPSCPPGRKDLMVRDSRPFFSSRAADPENGFLYPGTGDCGNLEPVHGPRNLAYVIYTSGSTGTPKGVLVEHRNVVNLVKGLKEKVYGEYNGPLRVALAAPYFFDGSVKQIFGALLLGHTLVLVPEKTRTDGRWLAAFYNTYGIDIADGTPAHIRLMSGAGPVPRVRRFLIGGEVLSKQVVEMFLEKFDGNTLPVITNVYGPTECCVDTTAFDVSKENIDSLISIPIGKPLAGQVVTIIGPEGKLLENGTPGELCISGANVARGYLNRPEQTAEKFRRAPPPFFLLTPYPLPLTPFYRTGDLVRRLSDGNIEFLGRLDTQVKIRGYRIELGEIENRLLMVPGVTGAVVAARDTDEGDKYLCAYIVAAPDVGEKIPAAKIREYLARNLPDYMIPPYFVRLERFPLTPNGKVDGDALPVPDAAASSPGPYTPYTAPRDEIESVLAGIWSRLLPITVERVSSGVDFFSIGGHSLTATILASRIEKTFNVRFTPGRVFRCPTIRAMARVIKGETVGRFEEIPPVEKKEFYPLSSAQKRLFFLDRMDSIGTTYNMTYAFTVKGKPDYQRLEQCFIHLIRRHESFRTSFHLIDDLPAQRIHDHVDFKIDSLPLTPYPLPLTPSLPLFFLRPFDLSRAPLLRVGVVTVSEDESRLFIDMHHIIADGTSMGILFEELSHLYNGENLEAGAARWDVLSIQYKEFTHWRERLSRGGKIKEQEEYWSGLYPVSSEIPRLHLPGDFPRPDCMGFRGDRFRFSLSPEDTRQFHQLTRRGGVTLYMNLLAVFNVLLYKYTQREDIIVGTGTLGRRHVSLEAIIGMFVDTLAMRNYPTGKITYEKFLDGVKTTTINALENQDVQFDVLVDRLNPGRDASHNPLFDVLLVVRNFRRTELRLTDVALTPFPVEKKNSKFDISLFAQENKDHILFTAEYNTTLFKAETIHRFCRHFVRIIRRVNEDPGILLENIDLTDEEERRRVVEDFNCTAAPYPRNKTIHRLFEDQVEKTPDYIAVVGKSLHLTYRVLNERGNGIGNYLYRKKSITRGSGVGVMMDRSVDQAAVLLGVLKAACAYVPINPTLPEERIRVVVNDASIGLVISQKRYIGVLNRLQWECPGFSTFLCLDSDGVHEEKEVERNRLMNTKLWDYVGETAVDEVTGGGWVSSYTGEPIPSVEMDEYGDNILQKLRPLLHPRMRVLEIGCASGITMYRIAPLVGFYYGTDLSPIIIKKNRRRVTADGFRNIRLACLAAHEIEKIEETGFDLVIFNSVIQCFHGHNYLRRVIKKGIGTLGNNGYIFIGDVMDRDLKGRLIRELMDFKTGSSGNNYKTKTDWSAELFVSRDFFRDLAVDIPEIQKVEFSDKIYTIENELTRFRYDVLVTVDKEGRGRGDYSKHKYQEDSRVLEKIGAGGAFPGIDSSAPAYIMYTSGSTGVPKGVVVEHRGVVRLVKNNGIVPLREGERLLPTGALDFDASTFEIWGAMLNGLQLHLADKNTILTPRKLKAVIALSRIDIMWMTAPFFHQVVDVDTCVFEGLKTLLVGGDVLSSSHIFKVKRRFPALNLLNGYGPTENTTFSTTHDIRWEDEEILSIPIGKPISNSTVFILDTCFRPQPIGLVGELYVGGDGVARGYLNNPELTVSNFCLRRPRTFLKKGSWTSKNFCLIKSFSGGPGGRLFKKAPLVAEGKIYKTGDLARWCRDGTILFEGRVDEQVKIRGFRIELGEIRHRLLGHEAVKDAVVVTREAGDGEKVLCAYVVRGSSSFEISALRGYLSRVLPDYMVPVHFISVGEIPLTSNGKVDKKALPAPQGQRGVPGFVPPSDVLEKQLAGIWASVLHIDKAGIGRDTDFFRVGGHSLKAAVLVSVIHREFHVKLPLARVFSAPNIRDMAAYIRGAGRERRQPIAPAPVGDYYPLTSAQKRIFIQHRMGAVYNMPGIWEVEGELDFLRLDFAVNKVIERHESLRTSFHLQENQPVQKIHHHVEFEIEYFPHTPYPLPLTPSIPLTPKFFRPFDISRAPLLRVGVVKEAPRRYLLKIDTHHIISDGISRGIFIKELLTFYEGNGATEPPALQYKDYAWWREGRRNKRDTAFKKQETFWLRRFSGEIPVLDLPYDFPRPPVKEYRGKTLSFELNETETAALTRSALRFDATLYIVLLGMFNVLTARLSGAEDIVVGTPVAGRGRSDLQNVMGMFVETLALRNFPKGDTPFGKFLEGVRDHSLEAFENQDYPFEELVEKTIVSRDAGRNPLFDVMFAVQNMERPQTEIPGLILRPRSFQSGFVNFDLFMQAVEHDRVIRFTLNYNISLFKEVTIRRFIACFRQLVSAATRDLSQKIAGIDIVPEEEKIQVLVNFNRTEKPFPEDKTVNRLFEARAAKTPDHIALIGLISPIRPIGSLSYGALNEKAARLARVLREKGVKPGHIVGLKMERSVELIIGMLGILKAGAAYLPMDPQLPEKRIEYMLSDSGTEVCLNSFPPDNPLLRGGAEGRGVSNLAGSPASIIYTSGSTGKPKGVIISHRSMVNFITGAAAIIPYKPGDTMFSLTTVSFDIFVSETLLPLSRGCRVILGTPEQQADPVFFAAAMAMESISHLQVTPSRLLLLMGHSDSARSLKQLRYLMVGGEVFPQPLLEEVRRLIRGKIYNFYGPTETTIWSTLRDVSGGDRGVNIGIPIANTRVYILNPGGRVQPIGVTGELCIGGAGLARGYLNNPELTNSKFQITNQKIYKRFVGVQGGKLRVFQKSPLAAGGSIYKSGDLARWLGDGTIEFAGRIDSQIKIRGYRVEPGEIETELVKHEEIGAAVVTVVLDGAGDRQLCAYITARREKTEPELRDYLAGSLPGYMIPAYFVTLERIPLTPNGKVNRKALPPPGEIKVEETYTAPGDDLEKKLVELWSDVLGIPGDRIGMDTGFFKLGGNSLKVTVMVSRVHRDFRVRVPMSRVFAAPEIRKLADFIRGAERENPVIIEPAAKKEYYPLTSAQKRIYILHRMGAVYNMPQVVSVEGELDLLKLEFALNRVISRHESLRTSFHLIENEPVQVIHDHIDFQIESILTPYPLPLTPSLPLTFIRPFDISRAPLLRVGVLKEGPGRYILMSDMHHIVSDGVSLGIFMKELWHFYTNGDEKKLPLLTVQYKDYAEWRRRMVLKKQETFWLNQFQGELPKLDLPYDFTRPPVKDHRGEGIVFEISETETRALKESAHTHGVTLYMVLLALFNLLSAKLGGSEDVIIGTPHADRARPGLQNKIGMFVDTLALRNFPTGEKSVDRFIGEVGKRTADAFENRDYPFEELVERVGGHRDAGRNPLFDVMLVMQNMERTGVEKLRVPGLKLTSRPTGFVTANFDLSLYAFESNGVLKFRFIYRTSLFKELTIQRFIACFKKIVKTVPADPTVTIAEIEIIPDEEKREVLFFFNDTNTPYPSGKTLHRLFEDQVEKTPDHIALIGPMGALSYGVLNNKSHRSARLLREKGVTPGQIVGLTVDRSIETIIGMVAILKAGGAYLPIDPGYPEARIKYMSADSGARILFRGINKIIDTETQDVGNRLACSSTLAYVIYTSGTSGRPKGVMVEHRQAVNVVTWFAREYGVRPGVRVLQSTSLTFDAGVNQVFGTLLHGGSLCLAGGHLMMDMEALRRYIDIHGIQIINTVPMVLKELLLFDGKLNSLRTVISGADRLTEELKDQLLEKGYVLYNHYGPTETTIDALSCRCTRDPVTLGTPIANCRVYILDRYGNVQPIGVPGELHVAGTGLARGYLNNPELTNSKFQITNYKLNKRFWESRTLFSKRVLAAGGIFYKTGDRVRWLPDGNIEFLGRMDQQVKIRGFRIEPAEIEKRLLEHPEVREAVVVSRGDKKGDLYLCAYVVAGGEGNLRDYLSQTLPDYMIPRQFVPLERIPLTANGKVDRKALPLIAFASGPGKERIAARDDVEKKLVVIWSRILDLPEDAVGIEGNFFELGGHSLTVVAMTTSVQGEWGVKLPMTEVFRTPTIRELAVYIKGAAGQRAATIPPAEKRDYYPLSSAQERLYILDRMDPGSRVYNMTRRLMVEGAPDREKLEHVFKALIQRHEILRTSFHMVNNEPVQRVHDTVEFKIESLPLSFIRPFDLSRAPLLRAALEPLERNRHLLTVDTHHIVSDAVSQSLLVEEFLSLYRNRGLEKPGLHYKDYALWWNSRATGERIKDQETYWIRQFEGILPVLDLPADYPRPEVRLSEGGTEKFEIAAPESGALREIAAGEGATLFMVLLAIFYVFLYTLSGREDIVVGTVTAGRNYPGLERVMGLFLNTLALRNFPVGEKPFDQFLKEVKGRTVSAFDNQDYPFDRLVRRVMKTRDPGRHPLFDVMFAFSPRTGQRKPPDSELSAGPRFIPVKGNAVESHFDMILTGADNGETFTFLFEYTAGLFKPGTIKRFSGYFKEVVSSVTASPTILLKDVVVSTNLSPTVSDDFQDGEEDFGF